MQSSFANTQGGVLIWGIHAAKDADGIDEASDFKHVPNPQKLASRLTELQRVSTDPPVDGVQIEPIIDSTRSDGSGFVVCFVPESDDAPHRALFQGQQFYYRSLDKSVVMPVSLLRRMFYPKSQTRLTVSTTLSFVTQGQEPNAELLLRCQASIENAGFTTAYNINIGMEWNATHGNSIHANTHWITTENTRFRHFFMRTLDLNPGVSSMFAFLPDWRTQKTIITSTNNGAKVLAPLFDDIEIEYFVFARDYDPISTVVRFSPHDFATGETKICKDGDTRKLR